MLLCRVVLSDDSAEHAAWPLCAALHGFRRNESRAETPSGPFH
jgi:hypothetical protein